MATRDAEGYNPAIVAPSAVTVKITDTKLYVPVVSLSRENNIKLLEQLATGFKRTVKGTNTDNKWLFSHKRST